jgi:putative endonuclease
MKLGHNYYVYIVECRDGSYYIGITNDLERRMWEHNTGHDPSCYTFDRRPVELKYFEHYTDINQAISREKQLKGWSRKKKQALFKENWNELRRLSKSSTIESNPGNPSTSSG